MARPKGSRNKPRDEKSVVVATKTPERVTTRSNVATPSVMDSLNAYGEALTEGGEKVAAILNELVEGFEALQARIGSDNGPIPKQPSKAAEKPSGKKTTKVASPEPQEPDFDSMDEETLQDFIDDNNLDVDLSDYKTMSKKRGAVEDAYEEAHDGDSDEVDDPPDFDAMTLDELEDFIEENSLDVHLDEYKGMSKKRQAVAEAYVDVEEDDDKADFDD